MKIDVYIHPSTDTDQDVHRKLDRMLAMLVALTTQEKHMSDTIDTILTGVQDAGTFEASIFQLLQNVLATNGVPQAKIDATITALNANHATLQAMNDALTAGTVVPPIPAPAAPVVV